MSEPFLLFPESPTTASGPTLYVTNWSSKRLHGSGVKLGIMASPRPWEQGDGRVPALQVPLRQLVRLKRREVSRADLLQQFGEALAAHRADLTPGHLQRDDGSPVQDGETLCCCCSQADARDGLCHRVEVARALAASGWRVILDGQQVR